MQRRVSLKYSWLSKPSLNNEFKGAIKFNHNSREFAINITHKDTVDIVCQKIVTPAKGAKMSRRINSMPNSTYKIKKNSNTTSDNTTSDSNINGLRRTIHFGGKSSRKRNKKRTARKNSKKY